MHVPFAREKDELLLGEFGVDVCEGNAMEGQVPRCVPGVLPFVGHRNDVGDVEMLPFAVTSVAAPRRWWRLSRVAFQPPWHIEVKILLAPDHAGKGLPLNRARIRAPDA